MPTTLPADQETATQVNRPRFPGGVPCSSDLFGVRLLDGLDVSDYDGASVATAATTADGDGPCRNRAIQPHPGRNWKWRTWPTDSNPAQLSIRVVATGHTGRIRIRLRCGLNRPVRCLQITAAAVLVVFRYAVVVDPLADAGHGCTTLCRCGSGSSRDTCDHQRTHNECGSQSVLTQGFLLARSFVTRISDCNRLGQFPRVERSLGVERPSAALNWADVHEFRIR